MLTVTAALLLPALLLAQEVQIGGPAPDLGKERLQAIARARSQLSLKLKVPEAKIALESATPTTWPNASLGCPEPDRMYAQVVTRGWTVILKVTGRPARGPRRGQASRGLPAAAREGANPALEGPSLS